MSDNNLKILNRKKRIETWVPLIVLTVVGLLIFLTENRDGGFVPGGFYSNVSVHGITVSKNLTNSDYLLFMFTSRELQNDKVVYDAYNRFPVFPFLLTGLLTYPFEHNFKLQIYIARQLMNVFFFLSLVMVFKLVDELVKNKYLALLVSLITFSSYYMLTYNNLIFNDIPTLLGFVVALYCVVRSQKVKLKISHILFYSLFPISLGWQPYAVYVTWFIIDTTESMFPKEKIPIMIKIRKVFRQKSFTITFLAIVWGVVILGVQLFNEWRIIGGSFANLPSVNSALWRSGINSALGHTQFTWLFDWFNYLPAQTHSITLMLIPFWPIFQIEPGINASIFIVVSFIIYILIKYLRNRNSINKIHLILIFSGIIWAITMKQFVAMHEFQSIFYIGFTVSLYLLIVSRINRQVWKLLSLNISVFFLINVALSNHLKTPNSGMNDIINQFQNICNQIPSNSKIYFDGNRQSAVKDTKYAIDFFLSDYWFTIKKDAVYAISENPEFEGEKLTSNSRFNLFKISNKDKILIP